MCMRVFPLDAAPFLILILFPHLDARPAFPRAWQEVWTRGFSGRGFEGLGDVLHLSERAGAAVPLPEKLGMAEHHPLTWSPV